MNWDWYDLEKQTGSGNLRQRTPAQQRQADKKNKQLAERQALERELQNVTGNRNAIFDIFPLLFEVIVFIFFNFICFKVQED